MVMNLYLSVNSETKMRWKSFFTWLCLLEETASMCYNTPIKLGMPCDLIKLRALYPISSIALASSKGSYLTPLTLVCFELMITSTWSAILAMSRIDIGSFLSISRKTSLYFLLAMLELAPGLGHR